MSDRNEADLSKMPVQAKPCRTCPFEGDEPIPLEPQSYARYVANVANLQGQHLCHSANNQMICRGGRNLMLKVMYCQGAIAAPTDEAYEQARKEVLGF